MTERWKNLSTGKKIFVVLAILFMVTRFFDSGTSNSSTQVLKSNEFRCYLDKSIHTKGSLFWYKKITGGKLGNNCTFKSWDNINHLLDDRMVFCSSYCCEKYYNY